MRIKDLSDKKFGFLIVLEKTSKRSGGSVVWRCVCNCGKITEVSSGNLNSGHTTSCGCHKRKTSSKVCKEIFTKHGHGKTGKMSKTYQAWIDMSYRCNNKNSNAFNNYGGRGITVCERWTDYSNFLNDMGEKPNGKSLDRIDNNGNYEPNNCRWATNIEQHNNKRSNRLITYNGETLNVSQFARKFNLNRKNLYYKLNCGWSMDEILKNI